MNRDELPGKEWGNKTAVTLGRKSKFEARNVNNQRGKNYYVFIILVFFVFIFLSFFVFVLFLSFCLSFL